MSQATDIFFGLFWKYYHDPYAIYDSSGDRYYTGGLQSRENSVIMEALMKVK